MSRLWLALLPVAAVALSSCGSHDPPQSVLAERCTSISEAQPVQLQVVSQMSGTLRVAVVQRGISVVASVVSAGTRAPQYSLSPIDRFGEATFAVDVLKDQPITLGVHTRDSPDAVGEVCISAERLPAGDLQRLRAERAFAAGGQATQAEDWQRAFDFYRDAARNFDGLDRWRAARSRHAMSWIAYWNLRNDKDAYVLASWARADFGPRADPGLDSALLALQAYALLESERFGPEERRARVLGLLLVAEERARRSPFGTRELPRFDILRGFMDFSTDHTSEAGALFTGAAQRCETLRDWECAARARQNLAALAEEQRDYPAALQEYQRALNSLPENLNPTLSADIWGNFGRLQSTSGLFRLAELSHRKSIQLHANLADCDGTRIAIARLGTLLVQVGDVSAGRTYLARAASLECATLIAGAKRESAVGHGDVEEFGTHAREEPVCVQLPDAATLSDDGKTAIFTALLGLHDAAKFESDASQAQRCLSAARSYANTARLQLRLANAEGATLLERGEPAQADLAFERGLTIADRAHMSASHENRSLAYVGRARAALSTNRPAQARDFAASALTLGAARGDLRQVTESLLWMARSFSAEKATAQAASILQVAADLIEQVPIDDLDAEQRATWLATQHVAFEELTMLLAEEAGNDESRAWRAFEVSERGRARSLRYAISQATDVRATSSTEPASVRYRDLMRRITELAHAAQAASQPISLDALAKGVRQDDPAPTDESMPAVLQKHLAALNATVIEYAASRDKMFAFVIDAEHIRVVPLGSPRDIAVAAAGLYDRVRNPEVAMSDVRNAAQRVAELALWPLTDLISHKRVIFVPDDALHTVPLAILPWSAGKNAPLAIERIELSVMPSTLFVTHAGANHATYEPAPRFELIGDPVFRTADWQRECRDQKNSSPQVAVTRARRPMDLLPQLPGSREEVAAISELAHQYSPGSQVREHLGCAATPQALRAAAATQPTLLHIATHGYVDAYRPRLSALVLSPEAGSNGSAATFGLLDILQMKINSRLVVLSACDTSRGKLLPGEGVLGPAQAFLQAGAASVVASYWRIGDEATAAFMRSFYRHLLVERMTSAAALRQTQLEAAQAGMSHDWAAFMLFGWPDTSL